MCDGVTSIEEYGPTLDEIKVKKTSLVSNYRTKGMFFSSLIIFVILPGW